jgi:hypothetical protein
MSKYWVREFELVVNYRFPSCSKAFGKIIEQSCSILDVEGTGLGIMTGKVKKLVKVATDVAQDNYPETLGQMWLVNASTMFSFLWSMIKSFLDKKTVKKINVVKSNYKSKLLEIIDADNLPTFFGGNCTCSHIEGGCVYADIGPWNPEGGLKE